MFRVREIKSKGYILIYTLTTCSLCLFIALGCYKMEILIKQNVERTEKNILKVDKEQKHREYILTALDQHIYENIKNISEEEIKRFFNSLDNFSLSYEESTVQYNKDKDCFLVQYYLKGKFYKEELYEYRVDGSSVVYGCIDYSFLKGELK